MTSTPPGVVAYRVNPWVVANDRLKAAGWAPDHTNEEAYVLGDRPAGWASLSPPPAPGARPRRPRGAARSALVAGGRARGPAAPPHAAEDHGASRRRGLSSRRRPARREPWRTSGGGPRGGSRCGRRSPGSRWRRAVTRSPMDVTSVSPTWVTTSPSCEAGRRRPGCPRPRRAARRRPARPARRRPRRRGRGPRCRARGVGAAGGDDVVGHDPGQVDGHGPQGIGVADAVVIADHGAAGVDQGRALDRVGQHDVGADEPVQGAVVAPGDGHGQVGHDAGDDLGGRPAVEVDGPGRVAHGEVPGHPEHGAGEVQAVHGQRRRRRWPGRRRRPRAGSSGPSTARTRTSSPIADEVGGGEDVAVVAQDHARALGAARPRTCTSGSATSSMPPGCGAPDEQRRDRRGQRAPRTAVSTAVARSKRPEAPAAHEGHRRAQARRHAQRRSPSAPGGDDRPPAPRRHLGRDGARGGPPGAAGPRGTGGRAGSPRRPARPPSVGRASPPRDRGPGAARASRPGP